MTEEAQRLCFKGHHLRSQLKQMVEDAKTSDFPLRLRDIQLTI
jgi:hypothetical protein